MQFDVVIGNPPYQLEDGGGAHGRSASPLYHKFVEQAKMLETRYLVMVTPSRWFAGGKGLYKFRKQMLRDDRLRVIEDFPNSNYVFPGTQISGGVCYFLWDRDHRGRVRVTTHYKRGKNTPVERTLLESGANVFIRYNEGLPILRKVIRVETCSDAVLSLPEKKRFMNLVSARSPFGFDSTFKGKLNPGKNSVLIYQKGGIGYVDRSEITKNVDVIDKWKVFISPLGSGNDAPPNVILRKPFIGSPGTISSETYLYIGPFGSEEEAKNVVLYIQSLLFRFLVLLRKPAQHTTRSVYAFVPMQDFSESWTDEKLCAKYKITAEEWSFIESMIRPMGGGNE